MPCCTHTALERLNAAVTAVISSASVCENEHCALCRFCRSALASAYGVTGCQGVSHTPTGVNTYNFRTTYLDNIPNISQGEGGVKYYYYF